MKKIYPVITLIYATFILFGGVMGFVKANSLPSLIFGCLSATLLFISAWRMVYRERYGYPIAWVTTATLMLVFTIRYSKTGLFFPAGFSCLVSLAFFILISFQFLKPSRDVR